jgi:hypothetical protein
MEPLNQITELVCPKCGKRGSATWDSSLPPRQRRLSDLQQVSLGFQSVDRAKKRDPHFECETCRIRAEQQGIALSKKGKTASEQQKARSFVTEDH